MVFLIFRAYCLTDRIFYYNYFIEVPCFYYNFKYIYISISFLFIKYKRCARLGKKILYYRIVGGSKLYNKFDNSSDKRKKAETKTGDKTGDGV